MDSSIEHVVCFKSRVDNPISFEHVFVVIRS